MVFIYSTDCSQSTLLFKKMSQKVITRCDAAYELLRISKTGLCLLAVFLTSSYIIKKG